MLQYKAWANDELFAQVAKLEPHKHAAELHAALRILNHIYVVERIFVAHLQGLSHGYSATNTEQTPTLEGLYAEVQTTDRWYLDYVATLSAEQLAERLSFQFVDADNASMSREEILVHLITHGGYHRGAVGRILAQVNVAPPRDIYTRFLHEQQPQRRQPKAN
ncbi:DinB family protein [Pseudomonas sp. 5P_3.1_Bac2]|uniref:DinB family protein n=1 Tax=Pseudomonas sp. 5P_3.1_Bac2 TaxID=2971617 RepID=UPI0021C88054|nr:DinB family protein [Pseudomonas sp. 5P_3.1_Bac2]MCU1717801.1 DinB family protein [Pseudomonas sp. 5P_3.1_Bac2]